MTLPSPEWIRRQRGNAMTQNADRAILDALEACDRHEKWPIDDDLAGYVPIDEIRAALTGIRAD